ncbi:MAG: HEPN domain-containing protein [Deltaproteobacteria bacterium]|nr:HEPN domain-containing protein [Deltaproteobacteria bacterium]
MKKITEEWLNAARDDLRVADKIISDETLTHMVAFHSQQCIEKALKAIMEECNMELVRIHNLQRLLEIVKSHVMIDVDIVLIEMMDKLYIDSRYPADFGLLPDGKPDIEDAEAFYDAAKRTYEAVKIHLEKASQSKPIEEASPPAWQIRKTAAKSDNK